MKFNIWRLYYYIRYDIPQGLCNLIRWSPIIWRDKDWDSHFIFKILQFKLKGVEVMFRKYGHGMNSEEEANKIKVCILLLNRLIEDRYNEIAFKSHNKKWGELEIIYSNSDIFRYKTIDFSRANAKTVEEKEQESKEAGRLYKHEDMLLCQDVEYLFKLMGKHILGWWD